MDEQNQIALGSVTQSTQVTETKKCRHTPIIIILIILLIGSCVLNGFQLWQGIQKDSDIAKLEGSDQVKTLRTKNDNPGTDVDESAISVTEAEKILAKYIGEGNSTMAYGLAAFYNTFISDFNEQQKVFLTYSSIDNNEKEAIDCIEERYEYGDCTGRSISYDLMNKKYQSLFGDYGSIKKENYTFRNFFYLVYDDTIDAYREFILSGGGTSPVEAFHKVISVKKSGEDMVATLVFAELNTDVEVGSGICGPITLSGELGVTENNLNKMVDSMSIYKFTLSPYDNSYVLTNVEKVK